MSLKTRKTIILAAIQTVAGTLETMTGADAMLVSEPDITPLAGDTVQRTNVRPYFGNYQGIHVGSHVMMTFQVELAGGGAVDTPPGWSRLMEGCNMTETITASTSVSYPLHSNEGEILSFEFYRDGQKHAMMDARGTVSLAINKLQLPYLTFSFTGVWVDPVSAADPTPVFTTFQDPIPVSNVNTPTVSLHAVDIILESLSIDWGNNVIHNDRPNEESVQIVDRAMTGSISFIAPTLTAKNYFTTAKSNTLGALNLVHGTVAGNIVTVASAAGCQILQPTYADVNGETVISASLAFVPTAAGDDELLITTT